MSNSSDQPFVDTDVREGLTSWLTRVLKQASPTSLIAEGSSDEQPVFRSGPRNYRALQQRESVYRAGGPVTSIVDARSLMTFGTGVEFDTTATARTDESGRDVAEWLTDKLGDRIDLFAIDAGIQSYYAGDAWPEIVETRGGEFSHLNLVDPVTVNPSWDRHGVFTDLEQVTVNNGKVTRHPLNMDDVFHFTHSNATGGPLGESLVERNMDEIRRFASNQVQRANAIRLHGSPHYSISVGSEGQSIPDKLMRRVRNQFRSDRVNEETNWVHGGDISVSELDSPGFQGMGDITETDARMLAWAFDFPLEWTNFGSAGLGDGTPAMSRMAKFERQARTEQRRFTVMLNRVIKAVIERYSVFPRDVDVTVRFGDVVSDQQAVADWLSQVGWAFHRDEVRELMDYQAWDESDDREAPPETAPETDMAQDLEAGGGGGLFTRRTPGRGDAPDPLEGDDAAKRAYTNGGFDTGNRTLLHASTDGLTREELVWHDVYSNVLWADDEDAGERALFEFDPEEVPEFVVDRLREALAAGALFTDFETVSSAAAAEIGETLLDSLDDSHGWSINSLRDNLREVAPELSVDEADRIARTETQSLVNNAREQGYREEFDLETELFEWRSVNDTRRTEVCAWISEQAEGGVSLEELKGLVAEGNSRFVDHAGREWTPHINCRSSYTRVV